MKIPGGVGSVFLIFLMIFLGLSFPLFAQKNSGDWKPWLEYSNKEKDSLRQRWSENSIKEVFDSLKGKKTLPVNLLNIPEERINVIAKSERRQAKTKSYDLRGIPLRGYSLEGVELCFVHLEGSNLEKCNLTKAKLDWAWLDEANFEGDTLTLAVLRHASLRKTVFRKSHLWGADMGGADLEGAELHSANFSEVKLQAAWMRWSLVDSLTNFHHVRLSGTLIEADNLEKVKNYRYVRKADKEFKKVWKSWQLEVLENEYRELKNFFWKEGMVDLEKDYHYWENVVATVKSPFYLKWLRLIFLECSYGYGSRPIRLIWYSLFIVGLFSIIFSILTLPKGTKSGIYMSQTVKLRKRNKVNETSVSFRGGQLFFDCFYFSLLSFSTFGYGAIQPRQWLEFFRFNPVEYKPVGWARIFVGIEAALGIWVFALLVTVLFGK